jgi:hypothetical protein
VARRSVLLTSFKDLVARFAEDFFGGFQYSVHIKGSEKTTLKTTVTVWRKDSPHRTSVGERS